jgi:hypothetical protein
MTKIFTITLAGELNDKLTVQEIFSSDDYRKIISLGGLIFMNSDVAFYTAKYLNFTSAKYSKRLLNINLKRSKYQNASFLLLDDGDTLLVCPEITPSWENVANHNAITLYNTKDKATLIAASSYANLSALFNKETGIITHVTNRDKCTIIHRFYDQWEPTHVHISLHPEQITLEFDNTNLGLTFMPTTAFNLEKIAA